MTILRKLHLKFGNHTIIYEILSKNQYCKAWHFLRILSERQVPFKGTQHTCEYKLPQEKIQELLMNHSAPV